MVVGVHPWWEVCPVVHVFVTDRNGLPPWNVRLVWRGMMRHCVHIVPCRFFSTGFLRSGGWRHNPVVVHMLVLFLVYLLFVPPRGILVPVAS